MVSSDARGGRLAALFGICVVGIFVWSLRGSRWPADTSPFSCRVEGQTLRLPELPEASGVAASRRMPGVVWAHNDSGEPVLFALTPDGKVERRIRVTGAQMNDWEDVTVGPCPQGTCVFIADIGDNNANREEIQIYRVREPHPNDTASESVERFRATYPDGPQDAEALFVLPDGALFIVTKGNTGPVALYRLPMPLRNDTSVRLERLAIVVPARASGDVPRHQRVTGATASPNGRWVALRTREAITFYAAHEFVKGTIREVFRYDVTDLGEPQGEALAIAADGQMWLAGEGGGKSRPGTLVRLACRLP